MNCRGVTELIALIKAKAAALEYNEDQVAFDKAVGEIDLLCYELRQTAWPPRADVAGIMKVIDDIIEEIKL